VRDEREKEKGSRLKVDGCRRRINNQSTRSRPSHHLFLFLPLLRTSFRFSLRSFPELALLPIVRCSRDGKEVESKQGRERENERVEKGRGKKKVEKK